MNVTKSLKLYIFFNLTEIILCTFTRWSITSWLFSNSKFKTSK